MNDARAQPPGSVPTLTEIVEVSGTAPAGRLAADDSPRVGAAVHGVPTTVAASEPAFEFTQEQVAQRVMGDLQRQLDLMLEYRLREALAPALTRAADGLIRDARKELASTLREVVAQAVAQEFARHRGR